MFKVTLAAARVNADMTQEELAKALNVNKATVFNWENGKSEPSWSQLTEISRLSGIPMDYIFIPIKSI